MNKDISLELEKTTEEMANLASVPMALWDRHSNACLAAAKLIRDMRKDSERLNWLSALAIPNIHGYPNGSWDIGSVHLGPRSLRDALDYTRTEFDLHTTTPEEREEFGLP